MKAAIKRSKLNWMFWKTIRKVDKLVKSEAPRPKGRGFCLTAVLRRGEQTGQNCDGKVKSSKFKACEFRVIR